MKRESKEKLSEALESAREAAREVKAVLESDKPLGKAAMRDLIDKMSRFESVVLQSMPFMADQFQRYMDRVTTEAKASVEAYLDSKLTSLGLAALKEEVRVKFLSDGEK
jgi:phage tail tape-measure protein